MVADSCYSDMLCFTNYIEFLSHDVGGGLANCYIISKGGFVKVLYNVIWGRVVLKIGIFCYIICGRPLRFVLRIQEKVTLTVKFSH